MKLFSEVSFSFMCKRILHIDEHTLHLTTLKIDHPKITDVRPSSKRDTISKEFLSDLSGCGVKS